MSASEAYLNTLARLSEAKAQTQSEAARESGRIWGNTIANIGQMVAQYPEQQAKLKEIANRADLTNLERQREQRIAATEQRQQQAQQQASQFLSTLKKTPEGLWDVTDVMQGLGSAGLDPQHIESLTSGFQKMNDMTLAERKRQEEANADRAHGLLSIYKADEPVTPESLSFNAEALKGIGGMTEADAQAVHDIATSVPPGTDLRPMLKAIEQKKKEYQPVFEHAPEGSMIFEKATGKIINAGAPKLPKTWAEIALDKENPTSPTQTQSAAAWASHQKVEKDKDLNPSSVEYYVRTKYGDHPTPEQVLKAHEEFAKSTAHGTAAGDIPVKIDTVDATGRPVTRYVPRSQAVGQVFEKAPPGTVANRLASASAVTQTGNDIIAQLRDPKIAAMVGPAMGRYNTLREFLGNPPPELAELAGSIESFALANMGVHGMRSVQGADEIKSLLDRKHTPESLIKTIEGLNKFSAHFMENEGRKVPASPPAPPMTPTPSNLTPGLQRLGSRK